MQNKKFVSLFTAAYALARPDRFLASKPARRLFVPAYFLYKKLLEDPFSNLVHRKPELFANGDILDIGANIGYTSSVFAGAVKLPSKVFAFEPDHLSYGLLEEVVRRKNLSAVIETINMAVGNSNGHIKFWHNERHSADHRVMTERFSHFHFDDSKISSVPVITVDTFVSSRRLRNISFVKIDVQGYELAVCEGMRGTLRTFPDICVCLEYSPSALTELGFAPPEILDFFRSRGFHLHVLSRNDLKLITKDELLRHLVDEMGYVDLLCSKCKLD